MIGIAKPPCLAEMSAFHYFAVSFILNECVQVASSAQFFRVTKGDIYARKEELFLSSGIFHCGAKSSCSKIPRKEDFKEELPDSSKSSIELIKAYGTAPIFQSCAIALTENDNREGFYNIQHEEMLHFIEVECKLIGSTIYAIAHHNSEANVTVSGYEGPGKFRRLIKYTNNLKDLSSFVDSSLHCRQLTNFFCHGSLIRTPQGLFTYLVDRNGSAMRYIGAGPIDGEGCECGKTRTCAKQDHICNCDKNDLVWRYDGGFVTEKPRLPLSEVRVGDTGSDFEAIRYSIGPVECQD